MRSNLLNSASWLVRGPRITWAPPEDGQGGGDQGGNTGGGNTSQQQNDSSVQDYGGVKVDLGTFWAQPQSESGENGQGSSTSDSGGGQQQNQGQTAGERFMAQMEAQTFGDVFTDQVLKDLGDGNVQGVNQAIQGVAKTAMKQSVTMSAQLMQLFGQELLGQVKTLIQESIQGHTQTRDDDALLVKEFPSAKDPKVKPVVQQVFNQSLAHTKGNREAAVRLTKDMLKVIATTGGGDFGTPPANPDDYGQNHPGVSSLLDTLLER